MKKNRNTSKWTEITLEASFLEMWMKQNEATYMGDFIEGTLLDNFVLATKNGYAAVYEHYVNSWESNYRIEFQRGDAPRVWANWEKFAAKCAEQSA